MKNKDLLALPDFIRGAIQKDIYDGDLYALGHEQGMLLIDKDTQQKAIESKYNGFVKYIEEAKKQDIEKAIAEIEVLEKRITSQEIELNEFIDESEIARLQKKILSIDEKLAKHDESLYEDSFLHESYELVKEEISVEKQHIKELREEYEALRKIILDSIKALGGIKGEGKKKEADKENILRSDYKEVLQKITDLEQTATAILDKKTSQIEKNYQGLGSYINELRPQIYRKSQILLYYLMSFIIISGEFYLIYNFTSEVLMPGEKARSFWTYFSDPTRLTIFAFCLALPLSIGMIFKLVLKDIHNRKKRAEYMRIWIWRPLKVITVIGLIAIAIPNSLEIINGNQGNGVEILTLFGLPINEIKLYCLMIFSPMLTLLLSMVGSVLFLVATEMHNEYANTRKRSLLNLNINWSPWGLKIFEHKSGNYKDELIRDKKGCEEKIQKLKEALRESEELLIQAKANKTSKADANYYGGIVENYKETGVSSFLAGHKKGVAETCRDWDALDFILFKKRKEIQKTI